MSTFSYNGIDLQMVQLQGYRRRIKFDSMHTYMWTEHILSVRGVYDPRATCYSLENKDPANVRKDDGRNPSFTDVNIRHQLSQPRGRLIFTAAGPDLIGNPNLFVDGLANDDLTVLESPPPGEEGLSTGLSGSFVTDANNGPIVLAQQITRMTGTRCWLVTITVQAHVNEAYRYYSSPAVLLSHVWSATEDIDRDGWGTRTIRGQATFRTDRLTQLQAKVDDYREALGHPVPDNCQRFNLQVSVAEPGNRLSYTFTDIHRSHTIISPNVTWIEATGGMVQATPGTVAQFLGNAQAAPAVIKAVGDTILGAVEGAAVGSFAGPAGSLAGGIAGGIALGLPSVARAASQLERTLPTCKYVITIGVWGNAQSTREQLARTALKILQVKCPKVAFGSGFFKPTPAENIAFNVDLMGRFVRLQAQYILGGWTTFFNQGLVLALNPADPGLFQEASDQLVSQMSEYLEHEIEGVATTKPTPGRSAMPGKLMRGSWLGSLVTQALGSPNQLPAPAPVAPLAQDIPLPDVE